MKEKNGKKYEKENADIEETERAVGESLGLMIAIPLVAIKVVIDFLKR